MVGIKTVADTLTSVCFLLGLYLIWLGLRGWPEAAANVLTIAALGPLAKSPESLRGSGGERSKRYGL